ncbi:prostaglandin E synthase 2 [Venturia canescens]|uniref:prostaglandin E synthase 2 n=1 Tax=Venturia canescens TaxID=32260 RepID=UPI001C9D36B1|nr:prostaglandin E synthase 2 [Venturia canescens]
MAVLCKLSRYFKNCRSIKLNPLVIENSRNRGFRTVVQEPKSRGLLRLSLISGSVGAVLGIGYALEKIRRDRENLALDGKEVEIEILKHKPPIQPSRRIISPVDPTGLKLTLYQYQTCPFCCKVRTFLDYYGLSYDVVEVDPVLRREIQWSTYKKVPILLAKVAGGYQPLNDSSMIVSVLGSYIHDPIHKIEELAKYYPVLAVHDNNGNFKHDVVNKYFLMYQGSVPPNRTLNDIAEERKWRKWADDVFVHTLSPNVYRTLGEAYQTFNWFSDIGKWEEYFPTWERLIMINIGACAMWLIGKRLKKRHHLKDDVRQSFYDEINHWLHAINSRGGQFMGGQNPDLSDLAVYGVLRSIEGCDAFKDALDNTKLESWYQAMKEKVDSHSGSVVLPG